MSPSGPARSAPRARGCGRPCTPTPPRATVSSTPTPTSAITSGPGFDVLVITDHWTLTREPSTPHLLVITGAELAVDPIEQGPVHGDPRDRHRRHPRGSGRRSRRTGVRSTTTCSRPSPTSRPRRPRTSPGQGGAAYIAHPYWSGLTPEVVLGAEGVTGPRAVQQQRRSGRTDAATPPTSGTSRSRPAARLHAIATDDCHYPAFDIGDAWTMVRAAERSQEAVLAALHAGHTYASNGPVLHEVLRDGDGARGPVQPQPFGRVPVPLGAGLGRSAPTSATGRRRPRILERDDHGSIVRARFDAADRRGHPVRTDRDDRRRRPPRMDEPTVRRRGGTSMGRTVGRGVGAPRCAHVVAAVRRSASHGASRSPPPTRTRPR